MVRVRVRVRVRVGVRVRVKVRVRVRVRVCMPRLVFGLSYLAKHWRMPCLVFVFCLILPIHMPVLLSFSFLS